MGKHRRLGRALAILTAVSALFFLLFPAPVSALQPPAGWVLNSYEGHVYDSSGAPMAGVTVQVANAEGETFPPAITDSSGYYIVNGIWGYSNIHAIKTGWTFQNNVPDHDIKGNLSNYNFIGTPAPYQLAGRIITLTGEPVSDVTVGFFDGRNPVPANPAAEVPAFGVVRTGSDGRYARSGLTGSVILIAWKADWTFSPKYMQAQSDSEVMNFTGTRNASSISASGTAQVPRTAAAVKTAQPVKKTGPAAKAAKSPAKRVYRPVKGKQNVVKQ